MLDRHDENLILSYLEGELDAQASAQFEALLAQDEPMRLLVEQLANDRLMLRSVPAQEAPASVMANVREELERQMLMDVRATGPVKSSGPVVYRFRAWHRWAGAIAAVVALGAGLTWHFDPFGWSQQTRQTGPIGEIASNTPSKKAMPEQPEVLAHRDASSHDAGKNDAVVAKVGESEKIAANGAAPAIGTADAASLAAPGGKGTVALALSQESTDALGASPSANADEKRGGAPQVAARAASHPTFQIELQAASIAETRQFVFAWADDNQAVEANRADLRRRTASSGGAGEGQRSRGEDAKLSDPAALTLTEPKPEAAKDRSAKPGNEAGGAAPLAAKSTPSPAHFDAAPPAPAAPGAAGKEKAANAGGEVDRDGKAREAAKGSPSKALAEGAPEAFEDVAGGLPSNRKSSVTSRQEIMLLVPADRVDSLVEHLEARTGQSLIVVREGDQTLLLSPQVANQRALKSTEEESRKSVGEQAEKFAAALPADKLGGRSPAGDDAPVATAAPAPGPAPAPAASAVAPLAKAEATPVPTPGAAPAKPGVTAAPAAEETRAEAKKQAAKDVKQVLVRIVIVEETK